MFGGGERSPFLESLTTEHVGDDKIPACASVEMDGYDLGKRGKGKCREEEREKSGKKERKPTDRFNRPPFLLALDLPEAAEDMHAAFTSTVLWCS